MCYVIEQGALLTTIISVIINIFDKLISKLWNVYVTMLHILY